MENIYWSYLDTRNSLVRWNVATGVISPPHLIEKNIVLPSQFLRSRLIRGGNELELEYKLETTRQNNFLEKVSRMHCLFVFKNELDAERAQKIWGAPNNHFQGVCLSEVEVIKPYRFSEHDSNWINHHQNEEFPENWIDLYWSGIACPYYDNPLWEILIDGRMAVLNQEMRQECYNRFEQDLKCTYLLRLSIMAPTAYSDLGKVGSFLKRKGNCAILIFIIKFDEQEEIRVLNAIKETHPQQFSMIKEGYVKNNSLCPDFRDSDYCLTHRCNPSKCPDN